METLPGTATAAGGTHPTGIHSCIQFIVMKIKLTCITYRKLHIGPEARESKANKGLPRRLLNPSGALAGGFASRSHNRLLPQQAESANSEGNCNYMNLMLDLYERRHQTVLMNAHADSV